MTGINMSTIEYSLFRAKFIVPSQGSFFPEHFRPEHRLISAVSEKPSVTTKSGHEWHIGNVRMFNDWQGYFAVGRTTTSTIEKFDTQTGDFIEEELEQSPYTHCVFDSHIGLIGIAKKLSLSQHTKGIASRLEFLLSSTDVVALDRLTVEVRPIPDPEGFLRSIETALRVFRFSATFRGPNPFDADEYFQKPLSAYLSAARGTKGIATIRGDNLDRDVIAQVTRSTAATGNEASARLLKPGHRKAVTVNLQGDPVKRRYEEETHMPDLVLQDLIELYHQVRHDI
jgi:hypothetical protein